MSKLIREIRKVIMSSRTRLLETYAKELQLLDDGLSSVPDDSLFLFNSLVTSCVTQDSLTDAILLGKIKEFKDDVLREYNTHPVINIRCMYNDIELSANVVDIRDIGKVETYVQDELLDFLATLGYKPTVALVNSLLDDTIDVITFKRLAKCGSEGTLCL